MAGDIRLPRETVLPVATRLYRALEPACDKIMIAGSLRREKATVGDIEIVAVPSLLLIPDMFGDLIPQPQPSRLTAVLKRLEQEGVLCWPERNKANGPSLKRYLVPEIGINVELYLCDEDEYGYIAMIRTGDADFTRLMMTDWAHGGLKPAHIDCKGGAKVMRNGRAIPLVIQSERELWEAWGLCGLPPRERNAEGVEKLRKGGLR